MTPALGGRLLERQGGGSGFGFGTGRAIMAMEAIRQQAAKARLTREHEAGHLDQTLAAICNRR
jgi:hypothetical protein